MNPELNGMNTERNTFIIFILMTTMFIIDVKKSIIKDVLIKITE